MRRAVPFPPKLFYDEEIISHHCLEDHCTKGQVCIILQQLEYADGLLNVTLTVIVSIFGCSEMFDRCNYLASSTW